MQPKENGRIYFKEMGLAALLYTVVTLGTGFTVRQLAEGSPWRIVLALLPVIPILLGLRAIARFVRRSDELQQKIQMIAAMTSLGVILVGCIAIGFLQAYAGFPTFSLFWIAMFGILFWGLMQGVVTRRFK